MHAWYNQHTSKIVSLRLVSASVSQCLTCPTGNCLACLHFALYQLFAVKYILFPRMAPSNNTRLNFQWFMYGGCWLLVTKGH
ncbi:hypothetical protein BDQ17DRAFT_1369464 [Cyathus striatus]|nr:hypothetical protein BDQ17DRAFT_1369464 [Cyathus striatus]